MFGFLKKKISQFVDSITKTTEEAKPVETQPPVDLPVIEQVVPEVKPEPTQHSPSAPQPEPGPRDFELNVGEPRVVAKKHPQQPEAKIEKKQETKPTPKQEQKPTPTAKPQIVSVSRPTTPAKPVEEKKPDQKPAAPKPTITHVKHPEKPPAKQPAKLTPSEPLAPLVPVEVKTGEQKGFAPKIGFMDKLRGVFSDNVTLTTQQLEPSLEELEMSLLESDVSIPTAQHMVASLRTELAGKQIKKSETGTAVNAAIRNSLLEVLTISASDNDLLVKIAKHKQSNASDEPFSIMFIGPNGAGKTTTIAKLARLLTDKGFTCVIAASDTFRAAAIDQISMHGEKLGVKVIKHTYGADPAAVAFDAIAHAKSKQVDVVLIDTAGRQDTNTNLLGEMEKINRVVKPTLKIFIGETIAGHALLDQITTFNKTIGLDGIILTKLDCDAKGGGALSVAFETKLPIYFVGLGQEYNELVKYQPAVLLGKMLEAS